MSLQDMSDHGFPLLIPIDISNFCFFAIAPNPFSTQPFTQAR